MTEVVLLFDNLFERHTGITLGLSIAYSEAARVCLDRHHVSPITISVSGKNGTMLAVATWDACDERTRDAFANEIDATEVAAYAIGLAAVEAKCGMVAVRRAETHTGADYYVAPSGATADDLEKWLRLEVSGVDKGGEPQVLARLTQKVKQALEGKSNLPAMAAVVGFRAKLVALREASEQ